MNDPWFLYIFHFDEKVAHAQHYIGITKDPVRREKEHCSGQGSPLIKAFMKAKISYTFEVVGDFPNYSEAKEAERKKKNRGGASKWCPICKEERK